MDEANYARLFPESIIPGFATKHNAAVRQADYLELVRHHGSYRCAGGARLDRNFVSVLLPRLQERRGVLFCSTRWHRDDLVGRLIEWWVLSYPTIAEQNESHRLKGEPLSPRYPLETRREHKVRIGEYLWSALFQRSR